MDVAVHADAVVVPARSESSTPASRMTQLISAASSAPAAPAGGKSIMSSLSFVSTSDATLPDAAAACSWGSSARAACVSLGAALATR